MALTDRKIDPVFFAYDPGLGRVFQFVTLYLNRGPNFKKVSAVVIVRRIKQSRSSQLWLFTITILWLYPLHHAVIS